jgi:DedD protein
MFKQKSDPAATTLSPADAVQQARTRARRRLIGAIVLLGIGIIGFPLVFETQPRPIPVDIPIEIPHKDSVPPLVAPSAPPVSSRGAESALPGEAPKEDVLTESRSETGREITPPGATASTATPGTPRASSADVGRAVASSPPVMAAASSAAESPRRLATASPALAARPAETSNAEAERARALLEGRPVAAAEAQRFVVQVGAFADAEAARETRQKVERLGLKTYTQVAQTSAGSRIRVRVGPFASRQDAETALAKAKAAGLDAVVLTL